MSSYELDGIWMSYRYCIGRHTISSHARAGDIALNAYGRMTHEKMQFVSVDINSSIYDQLLRNWLILDNRWSIPSKDFKPLEILYKRLMQLNVTSEDDFKRIRQISGFYDTTSGDFNFDEWEYSNTNISKDSFSDLVDLEIWQRLANLFDVDNHKWCKMVDGSYTEYYECLLHDRDDNRRLRFRTYKCPVDARNLSILTYIDEQFIEEDNINPETIKDNER